MLSRVDMTGHDEAMLLINAIRDKLIDPSAEIQGTADYYEKTILPRRFDEQKHPSGNPWKPSKRVIKHGGKTLTNTRNLRNSLKAYPKVTSTGAEVEIKSNNAEIAKYAALHNNGGRIKNRGGKLTTMPKRQYAWASKEEKQIIIRDIWIKGLPV
jgi:phage gpG-like protein